MLSLAVSRRRFPFLLPSLVPVLPCRGFVDLSFFLNRGRRDALPELIPSAARYAYLSPSSLICTPTYPTVRQAIRISK